MKGLYKLYNILCTSPDLQDKSKFITQLRKKWGQWEKGTFVMFPTTKMN